MGSLFIIGNGFDLAHGLPTAYKNFRRYILNQYPDVEIFKDTSINLDDYEQLPADEFAAEILVYAMDHAAGTEWGDFEDALSRINFFHKFPRPTEYDQHDSAEYNRYMGNYLLLVDLISSGIIAAGKEWQYLFSAWIKTIEKQIDSGSIVPRESLAELTLNSNNLYMTFNYTKTLQKVYGVNVVKHIHNRVGQTLIFGHGKNNVIYEDSPNEHMSLSSSFLNDFLSSYKKDTERQMKKYKDFFKKLDSSIDKVYSYGFSYSTVDNVYIKEVIKKISDNTTWFFTTHEASDRSTLRNKKIRLRRYGFKGEFGVFEG